MLNENELALEKLTQDALLISEAEGEEVPIAVFGNVLDFKPLIEWLSAI